MSQAVVIKSNKYGINLILDRNLPFAELLDAIIARFRESGKFFRDAEIAISFEGRELNQEEECQIVEAITGQTGIKIICIVDNDEARTKLFRDRIDACNAPASGEFYRGTLRSGQILESASSIVIVGDVNPGARIISGKNIVVLGALNGNAYAGASGDGDCFIVALDMNPIQIQIGDVLAKSPDKQQNAKKPRRKPKAPVAAKPQIAMAKDGNIYIEPVTRGILNNI